MRVLATDVMSIQLTLTCCFSHVRGGSWTNCAPVLTHYGCRSILSSEKETHSPAQPSSTLAAFAMGSNSTEDPSSAPLLSAAFVITQHARKQFKPSRIPETLGSNVDATSSSLYEMEYRPPQMIDAGLALCWGKRQASSLARPAPASRLVHGYSVAEYLVLFELQRSHNATHYG